MPCGKCIACLKRKRDEWVFRLQKEIGLSKYAYFVTLTYDDVHLSLTPSLNPTLKKEDLQNFFKRLRKKGYLCRYYAVGEYGGQTQRPHYHLILFTNSEKDDVTRAWNFGLTHFGSVNPKSISYLVGYILKKQDLEDPDQLAEFSLMSKKPYLGYEYQRFRMDCDIDSPPVVRVYGGAIVPLPRIYRKKIFAQPEQIAKLNARWNISEHTTPLDFKDIERYHDLNKDDSPYRYFGDYLDNLNRQQEKIKQLKKDKL